MMRKTCLAVTMASTLAVSTAFAVGPAETSELTFGFIRLTDMAALAIAYEKGYFEDEGLDVLLEPQANWNQLLEGVAGGLLDGGHMLAGQPLAVRAGYIASAGHIVTPLSLGLNGNAITVSNEVWEAMSKHIAMGDDGKAVHPIKADALKPVVEEYKSRGEPFKLGMVSPVSSHNYELRYWLAAGGIHPGLYDPTEQDAKSRVGWIDGDVRISVTPPPRRCRRCWIVARFTATAWANHGINRRCLAGSASRLSPITMSGRTTRRR